MYRLLIADGDADSREAIKNILDWPSYGFSVMITAVSYAEAVNKALDLNPHVALIDVRLGQRWGHEVAEHLRAIGLKTSVCMISDSNDPESIRAAMRSGARDYLVKPLDPEEVRRFLERVVVSHLDGALPESCAVNNEIDPVLHVGYSTLSKITNKIILVVKNGYPSPLTLTGIAESFHMSSKYIGRVFLKDTGVKFTEYLMAYRMLEAGKLIAGTQEKVSVIANMVGYAQLNNFYVHFKSYYGMSPSALRNFEAPRELNSFKLGMRREP